MRLNIIISEKGVEYNHLQAWAEEEQTAKAFYEKMRPLIRDLDQKIHELSEAGGNDD